MASPDLEALYREHHQTLFAFAYHRTHDRELSQDIVMDAWTRAIVSIDRWEERSPIRSWLITIVANLLKDHWRSYTHRNVDPVGEWPDEPFDPIEEWIEEQDFQRRRVLVRAEIERLPERSRSAMTLQYLLGASEKDAAARLGVSHLAMKGLTQRGRAIVARNVRESA